MQTKLTAPILILLAATCSLLGATADKDKEKKDEPFAVVYNDGTTEELKGLEIGVSEETLFGSSFKKLKKLPVKVGKVRLEIALERLAKIEVTSVDKDAKNVKLRLTGLNGKTVEGIFDAEGKAVWKATHPFEDSEATLDLAQIKEVILRPEKK